MPTKDEIRAQLDALGIEYTSDALKDDLLDLLPDEPQATSGEVVFRCERYPNLIVHNGQKRIARFESGVLHTSDHDVIRFVERIPEVRQE